MKRFLPIFVLFLFFLQLVFAHVAPEIAYAQTVTPTTSPTFTPTPTVPSSLEQNEAAPSDLPGDWIIDPEVTSIGKNAARAGIFLDWAIQNYDWAYVDVTSGKSNPLIPFWVTIRNIVYAFLILVIIAGSLVLIITRGRSVTLRKFIPRFLIIAVLVTFSFAFVEFLYQIVDVIQGFFIRPGGIPISQKDLLFIGWKYQPFVGLRALGSENFESAFISLLLVKLTSFTYYAMVGILLIRKIILWFFIMISPFFPLLLLFYPLRNTAKIWLGEFFRWLLYAPLFAIFLAGLVSLWRSGIPLYFKFTDAEAGNIIFPTAVSILLGGPLQKVGVANSVNLADTFGLYLVALLMLWMVIIFPFILLQIFLDYLSNVNLNQNAFARQLVNFMTRPPSPAGGPPPPSPAATGLARALPFIRDFAIPKPATTGLAREIPRMTQAQQQQQTMVVRPVSVSQKQSVEKLTNISIPTMRDIVRLESTKLQKDTATQKEVERIRTALQHIANPETTQNTVDRSHYTGIRDKLMEESKSGNMVANTVLRAAESVSGQSASLVQNITRISSLVTNLANPALITSTKERERYVEIRERLVRESEKHNTLATTVLSAVQAMTSSSKNTLQTIVQTLAHPEVASERLTNAVTNLKETLRRESESGNQIAKTVLSVFEKLEQVERVSNSLLHILQLGQVKETKEREHFERIKETLLSEKEKNNTLATTILSQITKLSTASSTDEKSQILQVIKEAVVKEKESNTTLSEFLSKSLPELMEVEGGTTLAKVQGDLEKAKAEGNPLAQKLLEIAAETSSEKQKERLASLQTEIADAKAKGDPLATTLSDILFPKPKLAGKPDAFPTTNRIQEVSLDDYEAVKKMWTENYQNLDTTGNIGDNISKKDWISDDIRQIEDTIGLLTSQDAEKIETGMQNVSDILPFLLVGGFSESEIVAYLKAKQAAARDVLADIEKQTNDEDTKLTLEQHVTAPQKTATASVSLPDEGESFQEVKSLVRAHEASAGMPVVMPAPKLFASDTASTQMLRLANISIPSMRTVASYDEALLSHNAKRSQEVEKTQLALRSIANPALLSDQASKMRYAEIREALEKESGQGNAVAATLVSAGRLMERLSAQAVFAGVLQLQYLLQQLSDPALIKDGKEKDALQKLRETVLLQSRNGDGVASEILAVIEDEGKQGLDTLMQLREKLLAADASGNQLVGGILRKASEVKRTASLDKFHEIMGMYLLIEGLHVPGPLFGEKPGDARGIIAEVKKYAETGNDLARSILATKEKNDYSTIFSLAASVNKGADQFSKDLQTSLNKLSVGSPLVQAVHPGIQQALTRILSLLTAPQGVEAPRLTMLREQLVEAKKSGNALASLVLEKADEKTKGEMKALGEVLRSIDRPEALSDSGEKATFTDMRTRLEKEKAKNNELADEILAVAHALGSKTASSLDKSTIAVMLWEKLVEAKNSGDQTAKGIMEAADALSLRERMGTALSDIVTSLRDPEALSNKLKKEECLTLKRTILVESDKGNVLAKQLLAFIGKDAKKPDPAVVQSIESVLEEQSGKGDGLAGELIRILREEEKSQSLFAILNMLRGVSDPETLTSSEEQKEYRELREKLQIAAQADSVVAMSLLAGAERAKAQGDDLSEAKKLEDLLTHDQSALALTVKAFVDSETEKYEDVLMLRSLLHGMEHPDYVPDTTVRDVLQTLQKDLSVESQHGNPVAKQIEKTARDISAQGVAVEQELHLVTELYQKLLIAKRSGDARATEIVSLIHAQHVRMQATRLVTVMEYVARPENSPVGHEQDAYKNIKQELILERNKGDQLAGFLLSLAQSFVSENIQENDMQAIVSLLYEKLQIGVAEGNSFAMSILSRLKPTEKEGSIPEVASALLKAGKEHDPVAKAVFAVIDSGSERNRLADSIVLPTVNRIQEVSLDDYEAVRSMWEESYRTHDIPEKLTGERPTREEWLREDAARITSTIALLTSADQEKINEGMQEVSGILPFLLIGGFSLAEIIAYLKAKLQAAKMVLSEEVGDKPDQVIIKKSEAKTPLQQQAEENAIP